MHPQAGRDLIMQGLLRDAIHVSVCVKQREKEKEPSFPGFPVAVL